MDAVEGLKDTGMEDLNDLSDDAFLQSNRLSDGDRATLMGGSVAKTYKWTPSKG